MGIQGVSGEHGYSRSIWKTWVFKEYLENMGIQGVSGEHGYSRSIWRTWVFKEYLENMGLPVMAGQKGCINLQQRAAFYRMRKNLSKNWKQQVLDT